MNNLLQLDTSIFNWINTGWSNPVLDFLMPLITYLGDTKYIWIFILLAGIIQAARSAVSPEILYDKQKYRIYLLRGLLLCLIFALIYGLNAAVNASLKSIINRPRPFDVYDVIVRVSRHTQEQLSVNGSFPSGHANNAFYLAAIFSFIFRGKGFIFYGLAGLVALSRIYLGVHFPADVLTGAVLACGITWIMLSFKRVRNRLTTKKTDEGGY